MFKRRGRRYFYWARHIVLWELIAVAALFAIPFLFMSIIPVSYADYAASHDAATYYDYQYKDGFHTSIIFCVFGAFHLFVETYHDDIDALSTALIAAFTVVLAWSTVKLWRETERLAKGADDQSEKSERAIQQTRRLALATMVSARAARQSAAVAEKTLAFLKRSDIDIAKVELASGELQVRMKNYGRAAGQVQVQVKIVAEPWQLDNLKLGQYVETLEGRPMIAAGEDHVFSTRFLRDRFAAQMPSVLSGEIALRVQVHYWYPNFDEFRRLPSMSWYVYDFRDQTFIHGFQLPNFNPTKKTS